MKQFLCHLDEIPPGHSKGFSLDDRSFFIVREKDRVCGYRNYCPHLGVELNWQPDQFLDSGGRFIQCAMHGALFIITSGECIAGPCLGKRLIPVTLRVEEQNVYLV